jgi:antitoxin FitA
MADILIRGIDDQAMKRLKARAKRHGRSLQGEARLLLEQAGGSEDVATLLSGWKRRFAGRRFSGSAELIREDRDR